MEGDFVVESVLYGDSGGEESESFDRWWW